LLHCSTTSSPSTARAHSSTSPDSARRGDISTT
jgi:hypothetical protein